MGFTKARSAQAQRSIVVVFFLQAIIAATQIPRIPEIIKQIGNAVSVAKMRACVKAIMADAAARAEMREAAE